TSRNFPVARTFPIGLSEIFIGRPSVPARRFDQNKAPGRVSHNTPPSRPAICRTGSHGASSAPPGSRRNPGTSQALVGKRRLSGGKPVDLDHLVPSNALHVPRFEPA